MAQRDFDFAGTDRFELKRRLGAGGMGVVYEAHDRDRDEVVALKTLQHVSATALYRLKNEFRRLQNIAHPNLVSLRELVEAHGQWFFTMDLVAGVDFLTYVRGGLSTGIGHSATIPGEPTIREPLPFDSVQADADAPPVAASPPSEPSPAPSVPACDERRLRAAAGQLGLGVAALHAQGMVHRDIKPSNVLVTPDGRVVIVDFGLITEAEREPTSDGHLVGTAAYMSPEQAAGKPVGPEADWYSVGVVLYEALAGRVPFAGTPFEIFMDKQDHEPPPPRAYAPDTPADLDSLCADLLRFDPEERPPERAILERLAADQTAPVSWASTSSAITQSSPFVGREQELDLLWHAFEDTRRDLPVTVVVTGASGIGKTALIREFTDAVAAQVAGPGVDAAVLGGRCYERESVPFKAFDGLVDALSSFLCRLPNERVAVLLPSNAALLARVFPVLGRVEMIARAPLPSRETKDPHELRRRMFAALRELFGKLGERYPVILTIDDLQWADPDSLLLLGDLMRPPQAPTVLLLVATRPSATLSKGTDDQPDSSFPIPGDVRHIELQALRTAAASELASFLLARNGIAEGLNPMQLAVEARGHPLYIDALVRHAALSGTGDRHLRLDEAITARVAELPPVARRILRIVCVAEAPLDQTRIAHAAEVGKAEFAKQLSRLRVANLVRTGGASLQDTVEPYHDRVREAVVGQLDDDAHRHCHARLAIALERAGAATSNPHALVAHAEASGDMARAARYAEAAARNATEAMAFERAAEFYRTALRLGSHDETAKREIRLQLGEALINAGRGADASDALLAAAEGADPVTRLGCQRKAAEQLLMSGHIERGLDAVVALLGEIGVGLPATPRRALYSLLWHRAKLRVRGLSWKERHEKEIAESELRHLDVYTAVSQGLGVVDSIRAMDFQSRGLLLALRTGEKTRVARAIAYEAAFLATHGGRGLKRARVLLEQAAGIAREAKDPFLLAWTTGADGTTAYFEGRNRHSAERLLEAEAMFRDLTTGTSWELNTVRLFLLFALQRKGALADFCTLYDQYVRDAERRGDRYAGSSMKRRLNGAWLVRGRPEIARRVLEEATWPSPESGYHLQHYYGLWASAEQALYERRAAAALDELRPAFKGLARSLLTRIITVRCESNWARARLALAAAAAAEPAKHIKEARRCLRVLEKEEVGYARVPALLLRAGIAAQEGDSSDRAYLRQAIEEAEGEEMLLCAAAARHREGELAGGAEGRTLLQRSEEWMKSEGIVSPERMVEVIVPGFPRRKAT